MSSSRTCLKHPEDAIVLSELADVVASWSMLTAACNWSHKHCNTELTLPAILDMDAIHDNHRIPFHRQAKQVLYYRHLKIWRKSYGRTQTPLFCSKVLLSPRSRLQHENISRYAIKICSKMLSLHAYITIPLKTMLFSQACGKPEPVLFKVKQVYLHGYSPRFQSWFDCLPP